MAAPLFDAAFLARLEYLALVSRRVFAGALLARRRTRKLGSGVEFADHRAYAPSDDFRYLDWALYARTDQLLLKRFSEEEDLYVYLLLDGSRSMALGEPPKFDHARRLAAALAYVALDDLDRVALTAFGGGAAAEFPPARGKGRVLALLDFLTRLRADQDATDLSRACARFVQRAPRRGLVVLLSDLYDPAGFAAGIDCLRHHNFEVHVIQVHDPREADPALRGDLELRDVETDALRTVTVNEASLRHYRRLFADFQRRLRDYCRAHALPCTVASTAVPFDQLLLGMMRAAGTVGPRGGRGVR
ncbi:MAG TPA: DUF58 domain-containing protein [Gemmataceae bacterium]|nr:DUF58 domain-containing protein [Gemmataceae bacterium]